MSSDIKMNKSIDQLWDDIVNKHFLYLDTDETLQKLEEKTKIEECLRHFLTIVPADRKFLLPVTGSILFKSVSQKKDFSPFTAINGFKAICQYANNLITKPWRKEYKVIKMYSGFYQHEIVANLIDAEKLFIEMGYLKYENETLVLDGPICPDQVTNVSRDAMIAYVECQIMQNIYSSLLASKYECNWMDIFAYRLENTGDVNQAVDDIIYTFEQAKRYNKLMTTSDHSFNQQHPQLQQDQQQNHVHLTQQHNHLQEQQMQLQQQQLLQQQQQLQIQQQQQQHYYLNCNGNSCSHPQIPINFNNQRNTCNVHNNDNNNIYLCGYDGIGGGIINNNNVHQQCGAHHIQTVQQIPHSKSLEQYDNQNLIFNNHNNNNNMYRHSNDHHHHHPHHSHQQLIPNDSGGGVGVGHYDCNDLMSHDCTDGYHHKHYHHQTNCNLQRRTLLPASSSSASILDSTIPLPPRRILPSTSILDSTYNVSRNRYPLPYNISNQLNDCASSTHHSNVSCAMNPLINNPFSQNPIQNFYNHPSIDFTSSSGVYQKHLQNPDQIYNECVNYNRMNGDCTNSNYNNLNNQIDDEQHAYNQQRIQLYQQQQHQLQNTQHNQYQHLTKHRTHSNSSLQNEQLIDIDDCHQPSITTKKCTNQNDIYENQNLYKNSVEMRIQNYERKSIDLQDFNSGGGGGGTVISSVKTIRPKVSTTNSKINCYDSRTEQQIYNTRAGVTVIGDVNHKTDIDEIDGSVMLRQKNRQQNYNRNDSNGNDEDVRGIDKYTRNAQVLAQYETDKYIVDSTDSKNSRASDFDSYDDTIEQQMNRDRIMTSNKIQDGRGFYESWNYVYQKIDPKGSAGNHRNNSSVIQGLNLDIHKQQQHQSNNNNNINNNNSNNNNNDNNNVVYDKKRSSTRVPSSNNNMNIIKNMKEKCTVNDDGRNDDENRLPNKIRQSQQQPKSPTPSRSVVQKEIQKPTATNNNLTNYNNNNIEITNIEKPLSKSPIDNVNEKPKISIRKIQRQSPVNLGTSSSHKNKYTSNNRVSSNNQNNDLAAATASTNTPTTGSVNGGGSSVQLVSQQKPLTKSVPTNVKSKQHLSINKIKNDIIDSTGIILENQWECESCTYLNSLERKICEICCRSRTFYPVNNNNNSAISKSSTTCV